MTVTSLNANQLAQANVQSLADIQNVTPGFRLDNHAGIMQPTIRGVTTSTLCNGCGNNVGIYVDGFYQPHTYALNMSLFDIDNIQVLKGPQGTLFGLNTVGGAVLINTKQPSTTTGGFGDVSYGSYNAQQYRAYVTTGADNRIAVDVGGWLNLGNGWTDNIYTNNSDFGKYQNWGGRARINWNVTDNFSLLFSYEHLQLDDPTGILSVPFNVNGQLLCYGCFLPGGIPTTERGQIAADLPYILQTHSNSYQLTATVNLDFGTLKSYSQYRQDLSPNNYQSYDFVNLPLLQLNIPDNQTTFSQEFLLTSNAGGRFNWTAGALYYNSPESYNLVCQQVTGPCVPYTTTGATQRSAALYANGTYQLLPDKLFLSAGLRYTHDEMVNAFWILFPQNARTDLPTLSDNRVTPRVDLRYALSSDSNVYAAFSQGYKAAIYNVGGFQSTPVKPETLNAYEIGYKYAANVFSANVSGFYYDYTNQQLASLAIVNGATVNVVTNAASSHMYGIDADMRYRPSSAFDLTAGLEWLHATYQSFPNAPGFQVLPNNLEPPITVDATGNQMERSPDFSATLGATYNFSLVGGNLALSANGYYTSKFYFDPANQLPQGGYATLGLRAAWTDHSGRFEVSLAGDNVTNTKFYVGAQQLIYGAGATWGAPATVMGTVRVNF